MTLLLDSLRIENYRMFKRLEIARLGRVNLLVGRNNSGKSSILEAVRLYASGGDTETLQSILESHDEMRSERGSKAFDSGIGQLVNGRHGTSLKHISIGPIQGDRVRQTLTISHGFQPGVGYAKHAYVSPQGITSEQTAELWDIIALTDLEQDVTDALRIIDPAIERISFIAQSGRKRIPMAKLSSEKQPVALRSLGDGVNRLLGIALSLATARRGVVLVDEIENGIHYAAQKQLWDLVFRLAHRLGAQVFATTHSWDCIEAFQQAAAADAHEEAALVRLDVHDDAVSPTSFSERELAIVTREQIEVR